MVSIPVASFIGSPVSALLLELDGMLGLKGWQWLFIMEAVPTILLGLACLRVLTDRPASAKWLTAEQRAWLAGRIEADGGKKTAIGHISVWQLFRNRNFLVMAMVCAGASATGTALSIWQPQILKGFGLSDLQTGFLNSVPYGIASVLMILWGRHSDRTGERRWHTALALLLIAGGLAALSLTPGMLAPTVLLLSCALIGAYSFKGPFWALSSTWMSPKAAAAGLAGINAIANLVGGGAISLVGIHQGRNRELLAGTAALVLLTLIGGISVLLITRQPRAVSPQMATTRVGTRTQGDPIMKASDLFVRALENEGVDRIFAVPARRTWTSSSRCARRGSSSSWSVTSSRPRSWPRPTAASPAAPACAWPRSARAPSTSSPARPTPISARCR
jgi:MFS family permease